MVLLTASLLLVSCGGWSDSRVNPRNWFGNSRSVETSETKAAVNPLIPRRSGIAQRPAPVDRTVPIATVTAMRVERTPTGAIVHATGVATRQGAFDVEIRPDPEATDAEKGVLAFRFLVVYPKFATRSSTQRSRTVNAAIALSQQDLRGVRLIRVSGAQNARETRRR